MKIFRTDSGVPYIFYPLDVGYTSLLAIVLYGMLDESKPELAHTLEHMLLQGTPTQTSDSIIRDFNRLSPSSFNASAEIDMVTIHALPVKRKATEVVGMLSDIIKNMTVPEKALENEKKAINLELEGLRENVDSLVDPYIYQELFSKEFAKHFEFSTEEQVYSITRDDILKDYKRFFVPENIVFVAYGGIEEESMKNAINKGFDGFKSGSRNNNTSEIKPRGKSSELELDIPNISSSKLYISMPGLRFESNNRVERQSLLISSYILKDRLYKALRNDRGIVYDVQAETSSYFRFGRISAYTELSKEYLSEAKAIMFKEIQKVHDGEINSDEISEELSQIMDSTLIHRYTEPVDSSMALGALYLALRDINEVKKYGRPEKITTDDVRAACSKYFDLDKAVSVSVFDKNK